MVVDLQGWYDETNKEATLTDPCVHCTKIGLLDEKDRSRVSVSERVWPMGMMHPQLPPRHQEDQGL